jgi:hypothetical protein
MAINHARNNKNIARIRDCITRSLSARVVSFLILFIVETSGSALYAQTIAIKLVDGRNGHPIQTCINVWVGNERKEAIVIPTDEAGIAKLHLTDKDSEINTSTQSIGCGKFGVFDPVVKYADDLLINVGYVLCQPNSSYSWLRIMNYSTKELIQTGIVSPNTCGKVIDERMPNKVTIFVRPLRWLERIKK